MNQMEDEKRKYDETPIPEELTKRISREIAKADQRRKKERRILYMKKTMAAAAAVLFVFTAALNTSTVFAQGVSEIPVLGELAKVLTFRSYEEEKKDMKISVEIPGIETISEDFSGLAEEVNEEIYRLCTAYAEEAVKRAEDYRTAFLETGGTEEEWAQHNIQIKVWYEVKSQTEDSLSLAVMGTENWTSAYSETRYYNFDLKAGKLVTLQDILGQDYAQIAEESVRSQAAKKAAETGLEFWLDDWAGVDENTKFYLNEAGNPVIVFEKYEIAPGAAGQPEFEIGKE